MLLDSHGVFLKEYPFVQIDDLILVSTKLIKFEKLQLIFPWMQLNKKTEIVYFSTERKG